MSTVLVLGAGAIGQWLTALLCLEGTQSVRLVCRPRQAAELRAGIRLNEHHVHPEICEGIPAVWVDTVILTVKTFQVQAAVDELAASGLTFRRIITVQNGLGSDAIVIERWPKAEIWVATTTTAVALENGLLLPASKGGLAIAPANCHMALLPTWWGRLGPHWRVVAKPDWLKWSKLLLNVTCNAMCALLDWLPGKVVAHPALFRLELEGLREAVSVLKAEGNQVVDLPGYPVRLFALGAYLPPVLAGPLLGQPIAKGRGDKPPSLLLDLRQGRTLCEVEWMNGAIARRAERRGLQAPVNRALSQALTAVVQGARKWEEYRDRPEAVQDLCQKGALL